MTLIFGTRASILARLQTAHVIHLIQEAWPGLDCREQIISTPGDRAVDRGEKGSFTSKLESALLCGVVHVAVHSLKDLPVEDRPGILIGAVPARDSALDALVTPKGVTLANLREGARLGTSSLRRTAQLLAHRPDFTILPLRGDVDTRLRKVLEGEYDGIVLAAAGLTRLGFQAYIRETLPLESMLPAPGQGALAVQCRADDAETLRLLAAIHDPLTYAAVSAERAFSSGVGGGCSLPVAAFAQKKNGKIILTGAVLSEDGKQSVRLSAAGEEPQELGERLAQLVLERGAVNLLA